MLLWVLELMLLPVHSMVAALEDAESSSDYTQRLTALEGAFRPHFRFSLETSLAVQYYHCRGQGPTRGLGTKILHPHISTPRNKKNENSQQN